MLRMGPTAATGFYDTHHLALHLVQEYYESWAVKASEIHLVWPSQSAMISTIWSVINYSVVWDPINYDNTLHHSFNTPLPDLLLKLPTGGSTFSVMDHFLSLLKKYAMTISAVLCSTFP